MDKKILSLSLCLGSRFGRQRFRTAAEQSLGAAS